MKKFCAQNKEVMSITNLLNPNSPERRQKRQERKNNFLAQRAEQAINVTHRNGQTYLLFEGVTLWTITDKTDTAKGQLAFSCLDGEIARLRANYIETHKNDTRYEE